MADEDVTARGQMRAWVRSHLTGKSAVQIPEIVREARRHLGRKRDLREQLADELFATALYDIVQDEVGRTRELRSYGDGGSAMTDQELEARAARFASRFLNWFEHAGDRNVQLMEMSKADLLAAASERRERGAHEYMLASLWSQLANGLTRNQVVRDRFSAEDVETIYSRLRDAQEGVA